MKMKKILKLVRTGTLKMITTLKMIGKLKKEENIKIEQPTNQLMNWKWEGMLIWRKKKKGRTLVKKRRTLVIMK